MEYKLVECHPAIHNMQECMDNNAINGWTFRAILPNNTGQYMWVIMLFERRLDYVPG